MANRKKRSKRGQKHELDLKLQKKNRLPDKEKAGITDTPLKSKAKDVNQNFRPLNTQGLRRGNR